jgi:hypothetical protein
MINIRFNEFKWDFLNLNKYLKCLKIRSAWLSMRSSNRTRDLTVWSQLDNKTTELSKEDLWSTETKVPWIETKFPWAETCSIETLFKEEINRITRLKAKESIYSRGNSWDLSNRDPFSWKTLKNLIISEKALATAHLVDCRTKSRTRESRDLLLLKWQALSTQSPIKNYLYLF